MNWPDSDPLLQELSQLPAPQLEAHKDMRIRASARAAFARAAPEVPAWVQALQGPWRTRLESVAALAGSSLFLGWSASRILDLLGS